MSIAPRVTRPGSRFPTTTKQIALSYLFEAWSEARLDGVDGDCLAKPRCSARRASSSPPTVKPRPPNTPRRLPARIRNGEFSAQISRQ